MQPFPTPQRPNDDFFARVQPQIDAEHDKEFDRLVKYQFGENPQLRTVRTEFGGRYFEVVVTMEGRPDPRKPFETPKPYFARMYAHFDLSRCERFLAEQLKARAARKQRHLDRQDARAAS